MKRKLSPSSSESSPSFDGASQDQVTTTAAANNSNNNTRASPFSFTQLLQQTNYPTLPQLPQFPPNSNLFSPELFYQQQQQPPQPLTFAYSPTTQQQTQTQQLQQQHPLFAYSQAFPATTVAIASPTRTTTSNVCSYNNDQQQQQPLFQQSQQQLQPQPVVFDSYATNMFIPPQQQQQQPSINYDLIFSAAQQQQELLPLLESSPSLHPQQQQHLPQSSYYSYNNNNLGTTNNNDSMKALLLMNNSKHINSGSSSSSRERSNSNHSNNNGATSPLQRQQPINNNNLVQVTQLPTVVVPSSTITTSSTTATIGRPLISSNNNNLILLDNHTTTTTTNNNERSSVNVTLPHPSQPIVPSYSQQLQNVQYRIQEQSQVQKQKEDLLNLKQQELLDLMREMHHHSQTSQQQQPLYASSSLSSPSMTQPSYPHHHHHLQQQLQQQVQSISVHTNNNNNNNNDGKRKGSVSTQQQQQQQKVNDSTMNTRMIVPSLMFNNRIQSLSDMMQFQLNLTQLSDFYHQYVSFGMPMLSKSVLRSIIFQLSCQSMDFPYFDGHNEDEDAALDRFVPQATPFYCPQYLLAASSSSSSTAQQQQPNIMIIPASLTSDVSSGSRGSSGNNSGSGSTSGKGSGSFSRMILFFAIMTFSLQRMGKRKLALEYFENAWLLLNRELEWMNTHLQQTRSSDMVDMACGCILLCYYSLAEIGDLGSFRVTFLMTQANMYFTMLKKARDLTSEERLKMGFVQRYMTQIMFLSEQVTLNSGEEDREVKDSDGSGNSDSGEEKNTQKASGRSNRLSTSSIATVSSTTSHHFYGSYGGVLNTSSLGDTSSSSDGSSDSLTDRARTATPTSSNESTRGISPSFACNMDQAYRSALKFYKRMSKKVDMMSTVQSQETIEFLDKAKMAMVQQLNYRVSEESLSFVRFLSNSFDLSFTAAKIQLLSERLQIDEALELAKELTGKIERFTNFSLCPLSVHYVSTVCKFLLSQLKAQCYFGDMDISKTESIVSYLERNTEALKKLQDMYGIAFRFDRLLHDMTVALQDYRSIISNRRTDNEAQQFQYTYETSKRQKLGHDSNPSIQNVYRPQ